MKTELNIENLKQLPVPSFKIDCKKYITPALSFNRKNPSRLNLILDLKPINNLDQIIIDSKKISVTIGFPFKTPHTATLISNDDKINIKSLIDHVRKMYISCYRNLTSFPCEIESEGENNNLYELTYPISSLHVDSVYFCHKTKGIKLKVIGNPTVRKEPDFPF